MNQQFCLSCEIFRFLHAEILPITYMSTESAKFSQHTETQHCGFGLRVRYVYTVGRCIIILPVRVFCVVEEREYTPWFGQTLTQKINTYSKAEIKVLRGVFANY
jgi:hypothetical protein